MAGAKLQELGNLRHFVRVGNANGKSTVDMDGNADCGNEAKNVWATATPERWVIQTRPSAMLDPNSWVEPSGVGRAGRPSGALERLTREGELLTTWPAAPFESSPTDCFKLDDRYWIAQPEWTRFLRTRRSPVFQPFLFPTAIHLVSTRSSGGAGFRPSIHSGDDRLFTPAPPQLPRRAHVVAFTGPTHAGKSTTAYGHARRHGWRLVADDTLSFSSSSDSPGGNIQLHPLKNEIRLRPPSADYFTVGQSVA